MTDVRVKVAALAVGRADDTLTTLGLGSCVAIVLYDARAAIGGLAHILLPDMTFARDTENAAKFPATAVPRLLADMRAIGAVGRVTAKIVGGASMFGALMASGAGVNMGERNIAATRRVLTGLSIPLLAEDVGGDFGRSVYFTVRTGAVMVKSLRGGERVL